MPAFDELFRAGIFSLLLPVELFNRGGICHIAAEPLPA